MCLHSRHRSGLHPVTHSVFGNVFDVVSVRPSSVEMVSSTTAVSASTEKGFVILARVCIPP